jgi:sugar/nucleoside kinase (ribokinase family)
MIRSRPLNETSFKSARLAIVGNINRDVKTAPFAADASLLRDGETPVSSLVETIGGGGANSAFTAAALGARVAFLGKVGADALGDKLEQTLIRHGIAAHLARDPEHATGTSLALSYADGQRHFVGCHPSSAALAFPDLDLSALSGFDHLLRADLWFSKPMLFGGNEQLFRRARDAGLTVSVDLNWDPQWGRASAAEIRERKEAARAALRWVHLAHGNVRELSEFADATDLMTALQRLEHWGVEAVVVHLGAEGAGYYHRGQLVVEPAAPVQRRLNTTGTGDVLSVCLMLLHRQPDIPAKLRLANAVVAEFMEGKRPFIPRL